MEGTEGENLADSMLSVELDMGLDPKTLIMTWAEIKSRLSWQNLGLTEPPRHPSF